MMTEKELGLYRELDDKFYAICDAYCQEMGRYNEMYRNIRRFIIDGPVVIVESENECEFEIPLTSIFKPIEEVKKEVDNLIEERNRREEDRKVKKEQETYEMLKKKFEGNGMS